LSFYLRFFLLFIPFCIPVLVPLRQKVKVPVVPIPVPQHWYNIKSSFATICSIVLLGFKTVEW